MSICICENCDQRTAEERPKKLLGALSLSQLYCKEHLYEAMTQSEVTSYQSTRNDEL